MLKYLHKSEVNFLFYLDKQREAEYLLLFVGADRCVRSEIRGVNEGVRLQEGKSYFYEPNRESR